VWQAWKEEQEESNRDFVWFIDWLVLGLFLVPFLLLVTALFVVDLLTQP
jgi:hypothetical protein